NKYKKDKELVKHKVLIAFDRTGEAITNEAFSKKKEATGTVKPKTAIVPHTYERNGVPYNTHSLVVSWTIARHEETERYAVVQSDGDDDSADDQVGGDLSDHEDSSFVVGSAGAEDQDTVMADGAMSSTNPIINQSKQTPVDRVANELKERFRVDLEKKESELEKKEAASRERIRQETEQLLYLKQDVEAKQHALHQDAKGLQQREQELNRLSYETTEAQKKLKKESDKRKTELADLDRKKKDLEKVSSRHTGAMTSEMQHLLVQQKSLAEQKNILERKEGEAAQMMQQLQQQANTQTAEQSRLETERQAISQGKAELLAKEEELAKKQAELELGVFTTSTSNKVGKKRRIVEAPASASFAAPNMEETNQWLKGATAGDTTFGNDVALTDVALTDVAETDVADDLSVSTEKLEELVS
ncbi:MAG: hypothetical protein SGARI_003342, partial [Bacillariaceae sp.]